MFTQWDSQREYGPWNTTRKWCVKKMNRMIMEHARCMRLHAGFPLQFWDDVINTVVYLINRGPSSALDGGILEEAWTGK